jgi:hypothetical protein
MQLRCVLISSGSELTLRYDPTPSHSLIHSFSLITHGLIIILSVGCRQNGSRDTKHMLECLKQSLKVAESCMDTTVNAQLYVDLLNEWLYYFADDPTAVSEPIQNVLLC